MALSFPNLSRSYDVQRHSVSFWGYDGMFEICFIVEPSAIARIAQGLADGEVAALRVFDRYRDKILKVASRVYKGRLTKTYFLLASDF